MCLSSHLFIRQLTTQFPFINTLLSPLHRTSTSLFPEGTQSKACLGNLTFFRPEIKIATRSVRERTWWRSELSQHRYLTKSILDISMPDEVNLLNSKKHPAAVLPEVNTICMSIFLSGKVKNYDRKRFGHQSLNFRLIQWEELHDHSKFTQGLT